MQHLINDLKMKMADSNLNMIQDSVYGVLQVPSCQKCCASGNGGNGAL